MDDSVPPLRGTNIDDINICTLLVPEQTRIIKPGVGCHRPRSTHFNDMAKAIIVRRQRDVVGMCYGT